ncbi:MAG TPA: purine-nucleoside phosphorylase, partial [Acidobacteriota bacterium]|nr:purine-nucleoside phosphorylase [Acidobacteriota bacterium]
MLEKIMQTADFLGSHLLAPPKIGMITGTGLGSLTQRMAVSFRLPYEEIPNFPRSTIEGHKG